MYREGQDSGTTVSVYKFKFKIWNLFLTKVLLSKESSTKKEFFKALENRKNKSFRGYDKAKPLKVQN